MRGSPSRDLLMASATNPVVHAVSELTAPELIELRALMDAAFGARFDAHDFDHCLGGTHLLLRDGEQIVAHAAVVERALYIGDSIQSCGYVEAVATLPQRQRLGLGSLVMAAANQAIRERFEVGALSTGSPRFYEHLGWRRWRGPAHVVVDGQWRRTPDEDDGILVLEARGGPLEDVTARIAVDDRAGDAW